ncbi:hypothetical protein [Limnofasciculus baicalensis]|uniref:Uncharacterized protein n=1 Tax=Limnofasciculus baicalensis BBK-W-15 TaxID=2699891 RepID=A0AAE3KT22_9CYAN|nr:hypothetical protein [Limnofasciculus baicalensis]MCP2730067.1 hypothetical protein [Limnofasciculus baicalensis BBK-W-15]
MARCLRHATRSQVISMKRLYPLSIVSPSWTSDAWVGICDRAKHTSEAERLSVI